MQSKTTPSRKTLEVLGVKTRELENEKVFSTIAMKDPPPLRVAGTELFRQNLPRQHQYVRMQ